MELRKKKARRLMMAGILTAGLISAAGIMAGSQTAYANSSEDEGSKQVVKEEKPDGTPFSVPGNAELLDDVKDDDSKQFITVRTRNNQTFFVVIDRQNSAENVYMLSMIDENDLEEFLDEEDKKKTALKLPEKSDETKMVEENKAEVKPAKKSSGSIGGIVGAFGFILLVVVFYYFFKIRPGKQNKSSSQVTKSGDGGEDQDDEEDYENEDDEYEDEQDDEQEDSKGAESDEDNVDKVRASDSKGLENKNEADEGEYGDDDEGVFYEEELQKPGHKSRHRRHHNRKM